MAWKTPDGVNGVTWTTPGNAKDDNTATKAWVDVPDFETSEWLEFTLTAAIQCNKVRFWVDTVYQADHIRLEVYYNGAYQTIFDGAPAVENNWDETDGVLGGTFTVTKARVQFDNEDTGETNPASVFEFDFYEVDIGRKLVGGSLAH